MDNEVTVEEKDAEIKRLHEVYDIDNVIKMMNTLNDENDKMYDKQMEIRLKYHLVVKKHNDLVKKYNDKRKEVSRYKLLFEECLADDDDDY